MNSRSKTTISINNSCWITRCCSNTKISGKIFMILTVSLN